MEQPGTRLQQRRLQHPASAAAAAAAALSCRGLPRRSTGRPGTYEQLQRTASFQPIMPDVKRCRRGCTTGARGRRQQATDGAGQTAQQHSAATVVSKQAIAKHPGDRVWDAMKDARGKVVLSHADRQTLLSYRAEASRSATLLRKRETQVQYFRSLAAYPRPADDRAFETFNEHFGPRPGAGYDQVQAQMFHMAQGANLCRMLAAECRELSAQASHALAQTEQLQLQQQTVGATTPPPPPTTAAAPAAAEWRTKLLHELQETRLTLGNVRDVLRQLVGDAASRAGASDKWQRALDEQRARSAGLTEQLCEARAELAVARRAAACADEAADASAAVLTACARTLGIRLPPKGFGAAHDCGEMASLIVARALELEQQSRCSAAAAAAATESKVVSEEAAAKNATTAPRASVDDDDAASSEEARVARSTRAEADRPATEAAATAAAASEQSVEKEVLTYIAKKTQHGWAPIFAELMSSAGVEAGEVARLRSEILYSFGDYKVGQAYAALKRWRRASGAKISYENLKAALLHNRRKDLADYVDRKAG